MTGTLAGALAARKIPVGADKLGADVEATVEVIDGMPLITKIKVHYRLKVPKGKREEALRAVHIHEAQCPTSQSIRRGIAIEFDGDVVESD